MPPASAVKLVADTIAAHKVVVFSKTYCPYCVKAKRALGQFLKPSEFFVLEVRGGRAALGVDSSATQHPAPSCVIRPQYPH